VSLRDPLCRYRAACGSATKGKVCCASCPGSRPSTSSPPPFSCSCGSHSSFPDLLGPTSCLALPRGLYRMWLWIGERSSLRITRSLSSVRGRGSSGYPTGGAAGRHPADCDLPLQAWPTVGAKGVLTLPGLSGPARLSRAPLPFPKLGMQKVPNKRRP
jgi:hypothetical protein